ncbi:SDR family oxidoreductase [Mangrovibrevibacter kandeliae]|uniref:SDR family oxidoreductase n=1 Tax=Mangrovibrevibacter kandeliae TaxID=2968473 RepID=UPI002118C46F|nr:SDR family oxidoreductase [Aurantimonas sp. CSK15Z-1]MCQ8781212.1 SDR family oxidoreductase [Aurantimonas sp. CSK15Z-1]
MTSDRDLEGRVALVSGSSRNIGRAIALELAQAGAAVAVHVRDSVEAGAAVVAEIEAAGRRAVLVRGDVADPQAVDAIVAAACDALGGLDILVNNAAIRRETAFADLAYAEWREVMAIILDGAYLLTRAALPMLARSGAGAVVNIGGLSAHTGAAGRAHVVAAKAGLVGLTRALAIEFADRAITVNCVAPGMIATARLAATTGGEPAHHKDHQPPVGRRGQPEDVARLVRYLAGPSARYLTGQTIHANGGLFLA